MTLGQCTRSWYLKKMLHVINADADDVSSRARGLTFDVRPLLQPNFAYWSSKRSLILGSHFLPLITPGSHIFTVLLLLCIYRLVFAFFFVGVLMVFFCFDSRLLFLLFSFLG